MDDSFQFIIESPQHSQGHKKRPRLVTSCDNCRLKKIKCLLPSPESKCEACKSAKIQCRFRDRERYFAERSRAIAGPNSGLYATELRTEPSTLDGHHAPSGSNSPVMSYHSHHSHPRSNSHSPKASGMVSADFDSARYTYTPENRHISSSSHHHHKHHSHSSISSYDPRNHNLPYYAGHSSSQPLHYPTSSRSSNSYQPDQRSGQLFDPENPDRPHPNLMTQFINDFFQRAQEFPFLSYQAVSADFWDQRLSSILANCIAAMASQMSNLPELSMRGLHNVSESYIDVAKNLLPSVAHLPSMETLHSIILLAWFEHSHHRLPGFRTFCAMAFKMANDLGLQDPTSIEMCPSEYERHRRRTTMTAIMQLHMTYNSVRQ